MRAVVARVTVTLPESLLARVDAIAADESVSRSDVVREAAAGYVTQHEAGLAAREREAAVSQGVEWLGSIATRTPKDPRPSLTILRELRGDAPSAGALIEPGDAGRRHP